MRKALGGVLAMVLCCMASAEAPAHTRILARAHTVVHEPLTISGFCPPPESGPAPPCPEPPFYTVARLTISAPAAGRLRLHGAATVADQGPVGDAAALLISARVDGKRLRRVGKGGVDSSAPARVGYRASVRVGPGKHQVELVLGVGYFVGPAQVAPAKLRATIRG